MLPDSCNAGVPAGCREGLSPSLFVSHIHRRHQCDVRQMRPAAKGIVQHDHVAGAECKTRNGRSHRHRHRAQMHGHVIAHGDHFTAGIKDGAGIVPPLFDIGRKCGTTQRGPHLLGDGVVNILEDFQLDGILSHDVRPVRGSATSASVRQRADQLVTPGSPSSPFAETSAGIGGFL